MESENTDNKEALAKTDYGENENEATEKKKGEEKSTFRTILGYILGYLITGGSGAIAIKEVTIAGILVNLLPNVLNYFFYYFTNLIYAHYCGQADYYLLVGYNYGQIYSYDFFFYLAYGFVIGISIICPAKFGLKKFRDIGAICNLCRLFLICLYCLYIIITFTAAKPFLYWIASDYKTYAIGAVKYVKYTLVGFFFEAMFEVECAYSKSHLRYGPNLHSILVSLVTTWFFSWLFLSKLLSKFDNVLGAALTYDIVTFLKFLTVFAENRFFNPYPESYFFFSKEIFNMKLFKLMMKICCLTMLVNFAESLGFSFSHFFLMAKGDKPYAIYVVILDAYNLLYPIVSGSGTGATLIIAYLYGEKNKAGIKKAFLYILAIELTIIIPIWIIFIICRNGISYFFSTTEGIYNDKDMIYYFIFNLVICIIDSTQNIMAGTLRGLDYMLILSASSITLFLGLMTLTTYLFLDVKGWGIPGVLLSESISYISYNIILIILMSFFVDIDSLIKLLEIRETMRKTRQTLEQAEKQEQPPNELEEVKNEENNEL